MLILNTTDQIRIVTDSSATIDVHASWADYVSGTVTLGRTDTAISSATTTNNVVAAPSSGNRNVKTLIIRNTHATLSDTVTVQFYDSSTAYQLEKRVLSPGQSIVFMEDGGWRVPPTGGALNPPWWGKIAGTYGDGDPGALMQQVQRASNVAATPTNITTSIARCSAFRLPFDLTVNRIRAFGVGATTDIFHVALYRYSDLARLTADLSFTTAVDTWVSIGSALNVSLSKDTLYFVAASVDTTGSTAGLTCHGTTVAATTGRVNTAPNSLPGNMIMSGGFMNGFRFQFAVTTGALPDPAATLAAQDAWTGGMPAFWLDNSDT